MALIIPPTAANEIRRKQWLEENVEPSNPDGLEVTSKDARREIAAHLSAVHRMFQHGGGIVLPEANRDRLRCRAIERLAQDLLGPDFEFEILT